MTRKEASPELRAAILRGALIEAIIFAVGFFLYFRLNSIIPFIVAILLGSGVFLFFVAQAGAFDRRNDKS